MLEAIKYLDGPATIIVAVFLGLVWQRYIELQKEISELHAKMLDAFIQNQIANTTLAETLRGLKQTIDAYTDV